MEIRVTPTALPEVVTIETEVRGDARGFFTETYNYREYVKHGLGTVMVQDNHSRSARGVLRGIHYQGDPAPMVKLVRCTFGALLDVAVDLRVGSPNFGKWVAVELSVENKRHLWVPIGFGHAFVALSEFAEIQYKCSDYYLPSAEGAILWNDPDLAIDWPIDTPLLSQRDQGAMSLQDYLKNPAFHYEQGA